MKKISALLLCLLMTFGILTGCSKPTVSETPGEIGFALLKGPTALGGLQLMEKNDKGEGENKYTIQILTTPDDAMAKLLNKEVAIAAVPSNMAAVLNAKTDGAYQVLAVNTLGVLHLIERGDTIQSIKDLEGKTVYLTGQGATPEYALRYLLEENNVKDVTITFLSEHAELATALAAGQVDIAVLPEPNATAVTMKDSSLRYALDFTKEWENIADEATLPMGCIVVNKEFAKAYPETISKFLKEYEASVAFTNNNIPEAAKLAEQYGILPSAQVAEKAIPKCNIAFLKDEEMEEALDDFYEVLYEMDAKTVGGKLPDEEFYYEQKK